jgi:bifunctional DNase/RNase
MTRSMLVVALAAACGGNASRATAPAQRPPAAEEDPRRVPDGYVRMEVREVVSLSEGEAVLLVDGQRTVLPIFIGGTEAVSIALRLRNEPSPRPLTHDLLDSIVRQLGGELVKVQVDRLVQGVYIGSVFLRTAHGIRRIDARPSDAIALAIGNRVPIYVARTVLDQSGFGPEDLDKTQVHRERRAHPPRG